MFRAASLIVLCALTPSVSGAQTPVEALIAAAEASFPALPLVGLVQGTAALCGGGLDGPGLYCTSERRIYLAPGDEGHRRLYTLVHLYGHALQVEYGLADIALRRIQSDRSGEAEVRRKVESQVDCLAGVLLARAGVAMPPLDTLFETEPMTGPHWGRSPVRNGPAVSIGLAARTTWFAAGLTAGQPAACTVEDLPADLLVAADAWPP